MLKRFLKSKIKEWASQYPVITVTGPRQSGKTTLCRGVFPRKKYLNLENPDTRDFAAQDPRGFLRKIPDGAILDEIQKVPSLLSYLQPLVDEKKIMGHFILTGSENFSLSHSISQSLAGRTALAKLLPFSFPEIAALTKKMETDELLVKGFYPPVYDRKLNASEFYANYVETYVERDLRSLTGVHDLGSFRKFVKLCAGRVGQILNLSSLANDTGITQPTAKHWLTLLETSYIAFTLPPYFRNFGKRQIKSPKLYFYDTGLACHLLGIETPGQAGRDPLRGALFENLVVVEILKSRFNAGKTSNLHYFRDSNGNEIDLILDFGGHVTAVEIKSSETVIPDFFRSLEKFQEIRSNRTGINALVYGGELEQSRTNCLVMPFRRCGRLAEFAEMPASAETKKTVKRARTRKK